MTSPQKPPLYETIHVCLGIPAPLLVAMCGYMRQHVGWRGGIMENPASGTDTGPLFRGEKSGYLHAPKNNYITQPETVCLHLLCVFLSYPLCDRQLPLELGIFT